MRFLKDEDGNFVVRSDWHVEDVQECATDNGVELTADEAHEVMRMMADGFDANLGINWEVIESYIDQFDTYRQTKKEYTA